jgi:hypothetical protein
MVLSVVLRKMINQTFVNSVQNVIKILKIHKIVLYFFSIYFNLPSSVHSYK